MPSQISDSTSTLINIIAVSESLTVVNVRSTEAFSGALFALFDVITSVKTIVRKTNPQPYITPTIQQIVKLKDEALKRYNQTRSVSDKEYYKDLRNYLSFAIREEKKCYLQHQISLHKNNARVMWRSFSKWGFYDKRENFIDA